MSSLPYRSSPRNRKKPLTLAASATVHTPTTTPTRADTDHSPRSTHSFNSSDMPLQPGHSSTPPLLSGHRFAHSLDILPSTLPSWSPHSRSPKPIVGKYPATFSPFCPRRASEESSQVAPDVSVRPHHGLAITSPSLGEAGVGSDQLRSTVYDTPSIVDLLPETPPSLTRSFGITESSDAHATPEQSMNLLGMDLRTLCEDKEGANGTEPRTQRAYVPFDPAMHACDLAGRVKAPDLLQLLPLAQHGAGFGLTPADLLSNATTDCSQHVPVSTEESDGEEDLSHLSFPEVPYRIESPTMIHPGLHIHRLHPPSQSHTTQRNAQAPSLASTVAKHASVAPIRDVLNPSNSDKVVCLTNCPTENNDRCLRATGDSRSLSTSANSNKAKERRRRAHVRSIGIAEELNIQWMKEGDRVDHEGTMLQVEAANVPRSSLSLGGDTSITVDRDTEAQIGEQHQGHTLMAALSLLDEDLLMSLTPSQPGSFEDVAAKSSDIEPSEGLLSTRRSEQAFSVSPSPWRRSPQAISWSTTLPRASVESTTAANECDGSSQEEPRRHSIRSSASRTSVRSRLPSFRGSTGKSSHLSIHRRSILSMAGSETSEDSAPSSSAEGIKREREDAAMTTEHATLRRFSTASLGKRLGKAVKRQLGKGPLRELGVSRTTEAYNPSSSRVSSSISRHSFQSPPGCSDEDCFSILSADRGSSSRGPESPLWAYQ